MMKSRIAAVAALVVLLLPLSSSAHTSMTIVQQQIVPGGVINGYGVIDNVELNEGPAIDGFITFSNRDANEYRLTARCVQGCGNAQFSVTVPASSSKDFCDDELPLGKYKITAAGYPTIEAYVRVVSNLPCEH